MMRSKHLLHSLPLKFLLLKFLLPQQLTISSSRFRRLQWLPQSSLIFLHQEPHPKKICENNNINMHTFRNTNKFPTLSALHSFASATTAALTSSHKSFESKPSFGVLRRTQLVGLFVLAAAPNSTLLGT